jgi:hypothetical protein
MLLVYQGRSPFIDEAEPEAQATSQHAHGFDRFWSFLSNRFLGSLGFFTRSASVTAKTEPHTIGSVVLLLSLACVSASCLKGGLILLKGKLIYYLIVITLR